jgi:ADP-ribose pyrophosphatase YjhB (NUDIX family)
LTRPVIRKVGAIILDADRRLLVAQKVVAGRGVFLIPGGKPEPGETERDALARELREELSVRLIAATEFGRYVERSAFEDGDLHLAVYLATVAGDPRPTGEITALAWIGRGPREAGIAVGSALENGVIPDLVARGLL